MKFKVGDKIYWYAYTTLMEGYIRYIKEVNRNTEKHTLCIETESDLYLVIVHTGENQNVFTNSWEPRIKKARELQHQAANLMNQAANLFSKSDAEKSAESEGEVKE